MKSEDSKCTIANCEKRHPAYYKFKTFWKFYHSKPKYVIENSDEIDKLEKKVNALESLKPKEKTVNDNLAKEMDIKNFFYK